MWSASSPTHILNGRYKATEGYESTKPHHTLQSALILRVLCLELFGIGIDWSLCWNRIHKQWKKRTMQNRQSKMFQASVAQSWSMVIGHALLLSFSIAFIWLETAIRSSKIKNNLQNSCIFFRLMDNWALRVPLSDHFSLDRFDSWPTQYYNRLGY